MEKVFVKFIERCQERDNCVGCPYNATNSEFAYVENIDLCLALYLYENYELTPKDKKEEITKEVKQEFVDKAYDDNEEYEDDEEE